ncbi:hypothetical protein B0H19DRAFT_313864 [Mycena capillaripes]|nr:hypothetical protein B0H19DRAFT_313864 [Mycena capillaripes]
MLRPPYPPRLPRPIRLPPLLFPPRPHAQQIPLPHGSRLPLASYCLLFTASCSPIAPWISWADTHAAFFEINQVPALFWRGDKHTQATVELSRWAGVICALAFFEFFGFAAEAREHYCIALWAVGKRCGLTPPPDNALPGLRMPWSKPTPSLFAPSSAGGKSDLSPARACEAASGVAHGVLRGQPDRLRRLRHRRGRGRALDEEARQLHRAHSLL